MLYKHWKKIVLALAGFFWASCDDTSSSPVSVENETPSSSVTGGVSSSSNATSGNETASSGEATSAASSTSEPNSVAAESSTSVENPRSSSVMDEPVDLYGCPSDICGPNISDSLVALYGVIEAKYGVVVPIEPDTSFTEIIAKYGVSSKAACEASQSANGNTVYKCEDGVTCEEDSKVDLQSQPCEGDVCPKYGVVVVSEKQYKCDNGKVYNEAEFRMLYDAPIDKDDN